MRSMEQRIILRQSDHIKDLSERMVFIEGLAFEALKYLNSIAGKARQNGIKLSPVSNNILDIICATKGNR